MTGDVQWIMWGEELSYLLRFQPPLLDLVDSVQYRMKRKSESKLERHSVERVPSSRPLMSQNYYY